MINRDEWLSALKDVEPETDPNASTIGELCDLFHAKRSAMLGRMRKLVAEGKAVPIKKRITDAAGRVQTVSAYRLQPVKRARKA